MNPAQKLIDNANCISLCVQFLLSQISFLEEQADDLRLKLDEMREKLGVES